MGSSDDKYDRFGRYFYFHHYCESECHLKYGEIIRKRFGTVKGLRLLEIGAGHGDNLVYFLSLGFEPKDLFANELLPERVAVLKSRLPMISVIPGDAGSLAMTEKFDVIFQSTVFTSVLDRQKQQQIANKMWDLLKPGGVILWYDFVYDSPRNQNVKGIGRHSIRSLFPQCSLLKFHSATLAPPIGRRVGKLYPAVNTLFPFLRTHVIAEIHKTK